MKIIIIAPDKGSEERVIEAAKKLNYDIDKIVFCSKKTQ